MQVHPSPAAKPLVTVAVPSFNQASFLGEALESIFAQQVPVEVFVLDGGSTDGSVDVIKSFGSRLAGWRSHADAGQAAAINEGIAMGRAPFVCWLNSDDLMLPGGLRSLLGSLQTSDAPVAYGRATHIFENSGRRKEAWVERFSPRRLAQRCFIIQPATLMRRSAWERVSGLDTSLHMALDYDLWWRLYLSGGPFAFVDQVVAANREHDLTKTNTQRQRHYQEAIEVVRRHWGSVPLKWYLAQPYQIWLRSLLNRQTKSGS